MYVGFCSVDVPPSPNSQYHDVGEPEDTSVNWTVSGPTPVDGEALKPALSTSGVGVGSGVGSGVGVGVGVGVRVGVGDGVGVGWPVSELGWELALQPA
jgi:hypothetical protein